MSATAADPASLCDDQDPNERCLVPVRLVRQGWVVIEANRPLRVGECFRLRSQ